MPLIVWAPPVKLTVLPTAVALSVLIVEMPPISRSAFAACVSVPVPVKALPTASELLLVRLTPVTVKLGMAKVPVRVWAFESNVCTPDPEMNVPLLTILPWKVTGEFPELFHVAPDAIVTRPLNVLSPTALLTIKDPLVPPPTVVDPTTDSGLPVTVKDVPLPITRFRPMVSGPTVEVEDVPPRVRSLAIVVVPTCKVLTALPEKTKL